MAQPESCSAMKTAEVKDRKALEMLLGIRQDGVWSHINQRKAAGTKRPLRCLGNDALSGVPQPATQHGGSTPGLKRAEGNCCNSSLVQLCTPHCSRS